MSAAKPLVIGGYVNLSSGERLPIAAFRRPGKDWQGFTRYELAHEDGSPLVMTYETVESIWLERMPAMSFVEYEMTEGPNL